MGLGVAWEDFLSLSTAGTCSVLGAELAFGEGALLPCGDFPDIAIAASAQDMLGFDVSFDAPRTSSDDLDTFELLSVHARGDGVLGFVPTSLGWVDNAAIGSSTSLHAMESEDDELPDWLRLSRLDTGSNTRNSRGSGPFCGDPK